MHTPLVNKLCLDSEGTAGPPAEVTQTVALEGNNAVRVDLVLFAFVTADTISCQVQQSNDRENWTDKGTAQSFGGQGIGRKLFNAETDMTAAYVRLKFTITGEGKAILAAGVNLSSQ